METQLLRTFVAVAEAGSLSAAALELGYAQSSVSQQVRKLERELDQTLLSRTSTGVELTAAGSRLLAEAARVLVAVDQLRRSAADASPLRIGTVDTLAARWLPDVLAAYAPAGVRPTIAMKRRDLVLRALIAGQLDVAFLYRPYGGALPTVGAGLDRLDVEAIDVDELVVVISAGERTTARDEWLVTQPGCVHREMFERHVARTQAEVRIAAEASTPDTLRQLALQGAGRAVLPTLAVADDLAAGGLVVDTTAPPLAGTMEIVAVYPADASADVHRLLRRAVDHAATRRAAPEPSAGASTVPSSNTT
jgi:DNA-binding transcriptional LysR family regulator